MFRNPSDMYIYLFLLTVGSIVFFYTLSRVFPNLFTKPAERMNAVKKGVYEREIEDLKKRVLKLEQELEQERQNGTPGKQTPRALRRLDEGRDGPDRR